MTEHEEQAPRCHFTPMDAHCADIPYGEEEWWECKHCGHTKLICTRPRS